MVSQKRCPLKYGINLGLMPTVISEVIIASFLTFPRSTSEQNRCLASFIPPIGSDTTSQRKWCQHQHVNTKHLRIETELIQQTPDHPEAYSSTTHLTSRLLHKESCIPSYTRTTDSFVAYSQICFVYLIPLRPASHELFMSSLTKTRNAVSSAGRIRNPSCENCETPESHANPNALIRGRNPVLTSTHKTPACLPA